MFTDARRGHYSVRDVAMLREIQRLSQEDGVNLAGVKRIIELEQTVVELRQHIAHLVSRDSDDIILMDQLPGCDGNDRCWSHGVNAGTGSRASSGN